MALSDGQHHEPSPEMTDAGWSGILATLTVSIAQSVAFYLFFLHQRARHKQSKNYSLYEPRQFLPSNKRREPFGDNWIQEVWKISSDDLLVTVGLDSYMFLRFLQMGMRISAIGVLFSCFLIPLYSIADYKSDIWSFNRLTLSSIKSGSRQLWIAAILWCLFVGWVLHQLWQEWERYTKLKQSNFGGSDDTGGSNASKFAVRVESLEKPIQSVTALARKFESIVPSQVRHANIFWKVDRLEKAMEERKKAIELVEKATAITMARPQNPRPQTRIGSRLPCKDGKAVDTIEHFTEVIEQRNTDIDDMREDILREQESAESSSSASNCDRIYSRSNTGIVVFASLVAKEYVMKREYPNVKLFPAADPEAIIWSNITIPWKKQRMIAKLSAMLLTIGVLFWAVPVTTVTALANLGSIVKVLGLRREINRNSAIYGLVSGLLPVLALTILMIALYSGIVAIATNWIRFKSVPEVNAYTLWWHMLFQFANLWLILIGGSFFNQIDAMVEDPSSMVETIANALPGASTFFLNMIIVNGLGSFGLELSMLPQYGINLVSKLWTPEAERTQRMIDAKKKPPEIEWGAAMPQHVFVFLVMIMYQPIVPLMDLFAFVYFVGSYTVWAHQCLHVYCQSIEGGGVSTWRSLFGFLMACLYMSEFVFIAYMGIKKAQSQAIFGFVPLVGTAVFHLNVNQAFIVPCRGNRTRLGEIEADQRIDELDALIVPAVQEKLYWQPCLIPSADERSPMPYRRAAD